MIRYPSFVLFTMIIAFSVIGALWTDHPIMTWVFMELSLISLIPFFPPPSAVRYFVVQAVSSIVFFLGVLSIDLTLFYWFGMGAKLGMAPFHWWVPLVYHEVSWEMIFSISIIMKFVPLAILDIGYRSDTMVTALIIISLITGAVGGLRQTSLKKLLGYSSISHIGWLVSSMMLSSSMWVPYLVFYMLNMLYMVIYKLKGISTYIMLLSLGGLPPLLGFYPKLMVLNMVWSESMITMIIMIISALISLYYYILMLIAFMLTTPKWDLMQPLKWFLGMPVILMPILVNSPVFTVISY